MPERHVDLIHSSKELTNFFAPGRIAKLSANALIESLGLGGRSTPCQPVNSRLRTPELTNYISRRRLDPKRDAGQDWIKDRRSTSVAVMAAARSEATSHSEVLALSAQSDQADMQPSAQPLSNRNSVHFAYDSARLVRKVDVQA